MTSQRLHEDWVESQNREVARAQSHMYESPTPACDAEDFVDHLPPAAIPHHEVLPAHERLEGIISLSSTDVAELTEDLEGATAKVVCLTLGNFFCEADALADQAALSPKVWGHLTHNDLLEEVQNLLTSIADFNGSGYKAAEIKRRIVGFLVVALTHKQPAQMVAYAEIILEQYRRKVLS